MVIKNSDNKFATVILGFAYVVFLFCCFVFGAKTKKD